jgi:RNA polymerase sigma-70 factor (ECF subfamily)
MPLTREEEKKLVIQSQKGDSEAMGILYENFQLELLRSAILLLKNEDNAQDIVSETFVLFFKSIDKFDIKYPIRPWLHRILHNQSTTFFQKRTRSNEFENEFQQSCETFEPNQEETVFRNEEKKYLQIAMEQMEKSDRWILEGYYYQELSVKELAVQLSIPEGTVKSRLFKARGILAGRIKELFESRSQEK